MAQVVTERSNGRKRVMQTDWGESRTEQSHRQETNINDIVHRYQKTGVLPPSSRLPVYGDFTGIIDYQSALNAVQAAQEAFLTLPPGMRKEFNNDPGQLLAFLSDESNRDDAIKLGLLETPEGWIHPDDVRPEDVVKAADTPPEGETAPQG